jgi:hypothetical protein
MLLQIKVQIKGITKPPVWRRLLVPSLFNIDQLHTLIQVSFGWGDSHLYQFEAGRGWDKVLYGLPDEDGWEDMDDSRENPVTELFGQVGEKASYIYDFGDNWEHVLTLEDVSKSNLPTAQLIDGKGTCPPEDCGGIWGYANLKEAVNDPGNPECASFREWLGLGKEEVYDPGEFDLAYFQQLVKQMQTG